MSSALPNLNMKHYKSVEILSNFQNVKSPCANLNPYARLSGDGSGFHLHTFPRDRFVAFDSYQSLTVTTVWVRFT